MCKHRVFAKPIAKKTWCSYPTSCPKPTNLASQKGLKKRGLTNFETSNVQKRLGLTRPSWTSLENKGAVLTVKHLTILFGAHFPPSVKCDYITFVNRTWYLLCKIGKCWSLGLAEPATDCLVKQHPLQENYPYCTVGSMFNRHRNFSLEVSLSTNIKTTYWCVSDCISQAMGPWMPSQMLPIIIVQPQDPLKKRTPLKNGGRRTFSAQTSQREQECAYMRCHLKQIKSSVGLIPFEVWMTWQALPWVKPGPTQRISPQ